MSVDSASIKEFVSNPVFWLLVAWLAKQAIELFKTKDKEHVDALKENSRALSAMNLTMVELKVRLESLERAMQVLPKIERDLNVAHERLRSLNPEFGRRDS